LAWAAKTAPVRLLRHLAGRGRRAARARRRGPWRQADAV